MINLLKFKRTFLALRKPSKDEYLRVIKISSFGIIAIGLIGFLISIIASIVV